jgi:hypothetical protein
MQFQYELEISSFEKVKDISQFWSQWIRYKIDSCRNKTSSIISISLINKRVNFEVQSDMNISNIVIALSIDIK